MRLFKRRWLKSSEFLIMRFALQVSVLEGVCTSQLYAPVVQREDRGDERKQLDLLRGTSPCNSIRLGIPGASTETQRCVERQKTSIFVDSKAA
jgi:hypothetical protein